MNTASTFVAMALWTLTCAQAAVAQQKSSSVTTASMPSSVSGPSLQETIAFMSNLYAEQGIVRFASGKNSENKREISSSINTVSTCLVAVAQRIVDSSTGYSGTTTLVDLARSAPTSVSIKPLEDLTPLVYVVHMDHAYVETSLKPIARDQNPAIPWSPDNPTAVNARVLSNDGTAILFINMTDGRLMSFIPDKKTKLETTAYDGSRLPAKVSDFTIGAGGVIYGNVAILTNQQSEPAHPAPFDIVALTDVDVAKRIAKALIHAMVLCHKDDKPSLF